MTEAFAHVGGAQVIEADIHVPPVGPWFADIVFDADPDVSGEVTLVVGDLEFVGTVEARRSGTRGEQRRCRIVAGGGGWGSSLAAKAYHADNGVSAITVAQDAAREAGETLGTFSPTAPTLGIDYVRRSGSAARALEAAAGSAGWWVGYDGRTNVGARATTAAPAEAYAMIEFDPRNRVAELALDNLADVGVGTILSEQFDDPQTVRELTIVLREESVRMLVWTGEAASVRSRVAGNLEQIVAHVLGRWLFGLYRYRCVRMSSDRVELQAVSSRPGLPDVLPLSMWPGVAGAHAELTPGAEVIVEFLEGDAQQPIVSGFVGKGGPGATPVKLTLDATSTVDVGANATSFVALANLVDAELTKITTTLGTGSNSGGPVVFGTPYVKAPVAATKLRSE